jgi:SNF2 family DNA or RNA helicase
MDLAEKRSHCVIFFLWTHQKECLIEEAQKRGITFGVIDGSVSERKVSETVSYFQRGLYKVIFAHPQSAAHSLTLTRGVATIWASPTYNLEHYLQGLRRIFRAGQTKNTETITIVAQGTIEEKVQAALDAKDLNMTELLSQMKAA